AVGVEHASGAVECCGARLHGLHEAPVGLAVAFQREDVVRFVAAHHERIDLALADGVERILRIGQTLAELLYERIPGIHRRRHSPAPRFRFMTTLWVPDRSPMLLRSGTGSSRT